MRARRVGSWRLARVVFVVALAAAAQSRAIAQAALDLCGCAGLPLTDFIGGNTSTYPPGTSVFGREIYLPLPPDGVLRFKNFIVDDWYIRFHRNAANTPVTLLVQETVRLTRNAGCCRDLWVGGDGGANGTAQTIGLGGLGGPGGFRGGDGAAPAINGFNVGGAGFGPGGGLGATVAANANGGTYLGVPQLLPLVGGSGGGGGTGTQSGFNCTGGGGGGGGGAILIVANTSITLSNYDLYANGGVGGSVGNGACARGGAGGSAGAIRLVSATVAGSGAVRIRAEGGGAQFSAPAGTPGQIRIETVDLSAQVHFDTNPPASRITGPGPLANPISPAVLITKINGNDVPVAPKTVLEGGYGAIDITLPAPGVTSVDFDTQGVPSGTTVEIKVKPRQGAPPTTSNVTLDAGGCDAQGRCVGTTTFNLAAGAYVVEARATFQVP